MRAGLVKSGDLRQEGAALREKQRAALEAAPAEETGRNAETVYRNKQGTTIGRDEWVEQQEKRRKKRAKDYPEQHLEWGGGLKQSLDKSEEQAEMSRIAKQPFARYTPDEKYLKELKEKSDWNDPMRKKLAEDAEEAKAKKPPEARPKCPFAPWPNRFHIAPGYRWDGKVRGTKFEQKWLDRKNQRELQRSEAYIQANLNDE